MLQRTIQSIAGLQVVAEAEDLAELPALVEQTGAQWVIVSMSRAGKLPTGLESLLVQHPSLCILGVANDGSHAELKWVEFHRERLGTLCTQSSWTLAPPYIASYEYQEHHLMRN